MTRVEWEALPRVTKSSILKGSLLVVSVTILEIGTKYDFYFVTEIIESKLILTPKAFGKQKLVDSGKRFHWLCEGSRGLEKSVAPPLINDIIEQHHIRQIA